MASKNVKTIQLLNGDNINISPATDITSLYYDYDDNGVTKRKYVFDQWPVKFNLVSDEINQLSTKSSTKSVDVKAGQTIQNNGEDILVSYVYQSILPGTNIYQLNASVYNLTNILSNYVGYTHFNTSLNALSNDITKSFDTSYNALAKNVSVIDTNIKSYSSSIYVLNNEVTEIVNNVSTLSSSCISLDKSVENINYFVKNINIAENSYPNIIIVDAYTFLQDFVKTSKLIPGMIYEIKDVKLINRAEKLTGDYSVLFDKMYLRALSKNEYDHHVLAIQYKDNKEYENFIEMHVSDNEEKFYISYLKDANNNEGNFDFTGYITGENNSIMLYESTLENITAIDGAILINGNNNEIKLRQSTDQFGFRLNGNYNVIENLNIIGMFFINSKNSIIKNTAFNNETGDNLTIILQNTIMENTSGFGFTFKDKIEIRNSTFINNIYNDVIKNIIINAQQLNLVCVQNTYKSIINIDNDVFNVYVSNYYSKEEHVSKDDTWYRGF